MVNLRRLDYATKDYEGFREGMVEQIPEIMPEWTDRSPNDPGIVLLELLAHQLEVASYYNDRVANEVFLSTATQRRSVINHAKLIGYELRWHSSARHQQVFNFIPQPEPITVPKGTLVGTVATAGEEAVVFELLEDLNLPAGVTGAEQDEYGEYLYLVEVEHGETVEEEFIGTKNEVSSAQTFQLTYSPILKETIRIWVENENGRREWTMVEDFIGSGLMDEHFKAEMDEYDRVRIIFGNGTSGRQPMMGSDIYASYKVGGGEIGNVGSNTITEFYGAIPGFVSTTNPLGLSFRGADKESIEMAKVNGPASLKRLDRYVTLPDYEAGIVLDYPVVAQAKAINVDGDVDLYLATAGETALSEEEKQEIMQIINRKKVMFTKVTIKDPTMRVVNFEINILAYDNYDINEIRYAATSLIVELMNSGTKGFGDGLTVADIHHALLENIPGIRNPVVVHPEQDVMVEPMEILQLGAIIVTVNGV